MASSIEIARFFLDNRFPVSQRGRYLYQDIQDLVFIADGYHMALFNEPLVDTDFYAFQHHNNAELLHQGIHHIFFVQMYNIYVSVRVFYQKIHSVPNQLIRYRLITFHHLSYKCFRLHYSLIGRI